MDEEKLLPRRRQSFRSLVLKCIKQIIPQATFYFEDIQKTSKLHSILQKNTRKLYPAMEIKAAVSTLRTLILTNYETSNVSLNDVKKFVFCMKELTKSQNKMALTSLIKGINSFLDIDTALFNLQASHDEDASVQKAVPFNERERNFKEFKTLSLSFKIVNFLFGIIELDQKSDEKSCGISGNSLIDYSRQLVRRVVQFIDIDKINDILIRIKERLTDDACSKELSGLIILRELIWARESQSATYNNLIDNFLEENDINLMCLLQSESKLVKLTAMQIFNDLSQDSSSILYRLRERVIDDHLQAYRTKERLPQLIYAMLQQTDVHINITSEILDCTKSIFLYAKDSGKEEVLSLPFVKILESFLNIVLKHKADCISRKIIYSEAFVKNMFEAMRSIISNHRLTSNHEKQLQRLYLLILSKVKESASFDKHDKFFKELHALHFFEEMCSLFCALIKISNQSKINPLLNAKTLVQEVSQVVKDFYQNNQNKEIESTGSLFLIREVIKVKDLNKNERQWFLQQVGTIIEKAITITQTEYQKVTQLGCHLIGDICHNLQKDFVPFAQFFLVSFQNIIMNNDYVKETKAAALNASIVILSVVI